MPKVIKMKIAVIGAPGSGKSSFIHNLLGKPFKKEHDPTENYQISLYKFTQSKIQYEVQLWESGCDHFNFNKHIRSAFFRNCSAALLMFDLSNPKWTNTISQWLEEAYQFDCYLVYAIGTKKEVFLKKMAEVKGIETTEETLTETFLIKNEIQSPDELEINNFFNEYQIRHFYQDAKEKIHYQIRNIFLSIDGDRQKITRSSLALGRRFDNTIVFDGSRMMGDLAFSIKEEIIDFQMKK